MYPGRSFLCLNLPMARDKIISGNVPRLVSPDDSRDTFVLLRLGQCWPGHCEECCKVGGILLNREKMDSGSSLDQLLNAEFKEAFNEFDKVCQ